MDQKELMMPYEKMQTSEVSRSLNGTRLLEMNLSTVCRQLARLIVEREQDSREHESSSRYAFHNL